MTHGVTAMPGKPTILGAAAGKPVVGTPGYPVSAYLTFGLFAKPVVLGLTAIKGIGDRLAEIVVNKTGVPKDEKIGNLSDEDIETLQNYILELSDQTPGWLLNKQKDVWTGEDIHLFGSEMDMRKQEDINMLKKIRCYRGIRHEKGQKVRGQRTKAHGRSGLTVGVVKKAQKAK